MTRCRALEQLFDAFLSRNYSLDIVVIGEAETAALVADSSDYI